MSVTDYRRQIEQEIEQARARARERVLDATAEGSAALESIAAAGGLRRSEDVDRVRDLVTDRSADPGLRSAALEAVTSSHPDPHTAHEAALERLADAEESPHVRRVALQLLKQAAFSSPSADEWRPAYLEVLREVAQGNEPELRMPALEVLAGERDRFTQELLLDGLRNPERALVPVEDALYLLSHDVHADVQQIAARIADDPPSERARLEALNLLAADPGSAQRFAALFADTGEDPKVRRLAATALSALEPETFRNVAREVLAAESVTLESVARAADSRAAEGIVLHTETLLELDE